MKKRKVTSNGTLEDGGQTMREGGRGGSRTQMSLGMCEKSKFLIRMSPPVSTRRFYETPWMISWHRSVIHTCHSRFSVISFSFCSSLFTNSTLITTFSIDQPQTPQMPSRILATIFSLQPHTILMSFPRIPNPIEVFSWSLCKFMQFIEPKSTPKWPVNSGERKLESSRTSKSSLEKERGWRWGCKQVSNGVRSSKETGASDFRDVSVYPFHKSLFWLHP